MASKPLNFVITDKTRYRWLKEQDPAVEHWRMQRNSLMLLKRKMRRMKVTLIQFLKIVMREFFRY